jgi:hypothetical protein
MNLVSHKNISIINLLVRLLVKIGYQNMQSDKMVQTTIFKNYFKL